MTIKDVQAYLRISRMTLHRLMKECGFVHIKLGKKVLFRKADVDAYLESKIVKNKPQGRSAKIRRPKT